MSEICTLINMGFSRNVAENALRKKGGDVEEAIDYLLSTEQEIHDRSSTRENAENPSSSSTSNSCSHITEETKYELILSTLSQYDLANGVSACTAIALAGVQIILPLLSQNSKIEINPALIDQCLFQGGEKYQLYQTSFGHVSVEHTSPDEVIPFYDDLECKKVEQGILKLKNTDIASGLLPMLSKMQHANKYCAVVITKPPETVAVYLPPKNSANESHYILFDSHCRPGIEGAHVKIHTTMENLNQTLEGIFPAVELGDECLNMMYNSFDLYLIEKKS